MKRSSLAAGSAAWGRREGELCRQQGSRKEHCQLVRHPGRMRRLLHFDEEMS